VIRSVVGSGAGSGGGIRSIGEKLEEEEE